MKRLLFFLCYISLSINCYSQSNVRGFVFEDKNYNGKKEHAEKGIANVAVSNGRDIVSTDKNGRYSLSVDTNTVVFVIKPSGFTLPSGPDNNYRFYFSAKDKTSKSVDFALIPSPESENFTSLIFGDPQLETMDELSFFDRSIVSELEGIKNVSFGISLGDIANETPSMYEPYDEIIKKIAIPWHNLLGNHDLDFRFKTDHSAKAKFRKHYGPTDYSFNYGRAHFILLDDILFPNPTKVYGLVGFGFRQDQREFIANDLKLVDKDQLVVVASHVSIEGIRESDRKFLFDLLKDFPNVLALSAHSHMQGQVFYDKTAGWAQEKPLHEYNAGTTCGSWYSGFLDERGIPAATMTDGTPRGYAFLNISGNKYSIDYKVAGKPKEYQMEITHPKVVMQNRHTPAYIIVNFFMGSSNDLVQYRIDEGKWITMTRAAIPDPNYVNMLYEWNKSDETKLNRWPSDASISRHIWRVYIPNNLPLGQHDIEVKATDIFGRDFIQKSKYRIDKPVKYYR